MLFEEIGRQGVDACLVRWDVVDAYGVWDCLLGRAVTREMELEEDIQPSAARRRAMASPLEGRDG